jgi:hypothetical protein
MIFLSDPKRLNGSVYQATIFIFHNYYQINCFCTDNYQTTFTKVVYWAFTGAVVADVFRSLDQAFFSYCTPQKNVFNELQHPTPNYFPRLCVLDGA